MKRSGAAGRARRPEELSGLCAQVAMMLNSGMPLYEGMDALAQAHAGGALAQPCAELSRLVTETGSLSEALRRSEGWPQYMVEMSAIGERTGRLEEVMCGLSAYYRRDGSIRRAIQGAVTYPIVLGAMMLLILLVMLTRVLPVFRSVMNSLGAEMGDSGNLMMRVGLNTGVIVLALVGALLLAALVCLALLRTPARARVHALLRACLPPLRRLTERISAARVASVLSMMLSGGFPLDEALETVPAVLEDAGAREKVELLRQSVSRGDALADAIEGAKIFDPLSNSMLRTACAAGCVDEVMGGVADDYGQRVERGVDALVGLIEPALVGVLAVVIGAILLSVMLPMAGVISSML